MELQDKTATGGNKTGRQHESAMMLVRAGQHCWCGMLNANVTDAVKNINIMTNYSAAEMMTLRLRAHGRDCLFSKQ